MPGSMPGSEDETTVIEDDKPIVVQDTPPTLPATHNQPSNRSSVTIEDITAQEGDTTLRRHNLTADYEAKSHQVMPQIRVEAAISSAINDIKDDIALKMGPIKYIHANSSESAAALRQVGRDVADLNLQTNYIRRKLGEVSEEQRAAQTAHNHLANQVEDLQDKVDALPQLFQDVQSRIATMEERLLEAILEVDRKIGLPKEPEPEGTETESNSEEEDGDSLHLSRQRQSSPARRTSIPKEARLKQPNAFNGKRGTEAETFIMKMEMYFKEYPGTFTDERKIRATLTNMGEGEPVKWASPLMQKHLSDEPHEYLTSWNAFKAAFLLNFSDPSKRDRAIREINSLKQTGSAQIYASQFRILKEDLDWDEKALIDTFKKGLKINLQSELICMKITTPEIDNYSLEQIIEVAIRTDDILQQAASIKDTTTPPSILKKGKTNNYRPTERFPAETFLRRSQAEPSEDSDEVYIMKGTNDTLSTYTSIEGIMDPIKTLIDSGSSQNFMDITFARNLKIPLIELHSPRTVIAIDGKEVEEKIRYKAILNLIIEGRTFRQTFYAMPLGDTPLILGLSWLREANPTICWRDFSLSYKDEEPMKGKLAEILELPSEIEDFQDVFSEELFKQLPQHRSFDCSINFKEGSELPKPAKAYPMSPAESKAMKEYMEKELLDGKIEPSHSPIASPCFFVRKADGGLRLVVDYRKINDITITDQFPMPLQSDLLEKVKDAKIFSKLDLKSGYNNIRIKAGEEWKTAFRTKDGLFQYCVMPFGLRNAPQIFQRLMNHIFHDMIDVSVIIYLDDILIYSRNREEHTKHLREVLRRIRDNNLYLKLAKCLFYTTEVTYIGIVITPEGISMEKEKIKAVQEWKEPKTVKQLQSFIGFANFYRRFIKDFSTIVKPLTLLTRQEVKWKWGEAEQQAFDRVKEEIGKDPVLIHPDAQKPYFLETDASGVAMGAVLSQRHTDGYLHPIAFLSKSFDDAQTNYDTHDKELLAIITSLEHWRLFLEGTTEPITVYTDHKNLEYWKTAHTFNRQHARWYQILAPFNFNIVYRPGKMSEKPDALSRRPDHLDIPNKEQIMIDPKHFLVMKAEVTTDIISQIREAQDEDESIQTLIATVKHKEELPPSVAKQFTKYQWKEELLWYEERIFVPDSKAIRLELLEQYHDSPIAGHQGQARTLELLSRDYYWPGMKAQVNRYVESCENCQRSKGHKHTVPIRPLPIPSRPWEDIAYDMIVKLPLSNGYDSILVVIDRFSKQAHFIPCIEKTNAKEMAEIFIKEVWKLHGTPRTTISDRGRVFNNEFQRALYEKLGIKPLYSTAYHPETDGLAERTNQWLEGFLRSYCNYAQDDWAKWLPIAEFCHNNQVNSTTGKSAFETVYGMHPRWNIAPTTSNVPHAEDMTKQMELIWDEVKASMEFHKAKEKAPRQEYKVGDKVLDLPNTIKIHNVFHLNLLAPFKEDTDFHRRQVKPPPIITEEGEEEYEVEKIVAWRQDKEGLRYQVRWKGYDELEDTMERAEKIAQLPEIMERFKKEFPNGPLPPEIKTPGKKRRQ
ncbi:hypothetical protein RHS01_00207 [Rhizoctonia solani]|uniref:Reverse transcriptase n=1 Tax=Rhizoctonia solani TaxID=456999 RepID=A0A8H7ILX2_9AGAM|nr:hypothetical protein RHS01_00207 [Rhizoctonia solani]